MNYLKDQFYYYTDAVGTKFCDDVIRFSKTINKKQAKTGFQSDGELHPYIRKAKVAWLSEKWIYSKLFRFIHDANRPGRFEFNIKGSEPIQYTRYSGEDNNKDHYDWHQDSGYTPKNNVRKLSLICNLTDPKEYKGGNLFINFPHPNSAHSTRYQLNFMKQKGSIIVFPSFLWHKVSPVTKGIRHSLVCWMNGDRFK